MPCPCPALTLPQSPGWHPRVCKPRPMYHTVQQPCKESLCHTQLWFEKRANFTILEGLVQCTYLHFRLTKFNQHCLYQNSLVVVTLATHCLNFIWLLGLVIMCDVNWIQRWKVCDFTHVIFFDWQIYNEVKKGFKFYCRRVYRLADVVVEDGTVEEGHDVVIPIIQHEGHTVVLQGLLGVKSTPQHTYMQWARCVWSIDFEGLLIWAKRAEKEADIVLKQWSSLKHSCQDIVHKTATTV